MNKGKTEVVLDLRGKGAVQIRKEIYISPTFCRLLPPAKAKFSSISLPNTNIWEQSSLARDLYGT